MSSSDLSFTIIVCSLFASWALVSIVRTIARRKHPTPVEIEPPEADAPGEVWVAYYDAIARTAATDRAPTP